MRKIILGIVLVLSVFMLGGCFSKKAITTDEFKAQADKSGYQVSDVKNQYEDFNTIKEATIAYNQEGFQVEFYVLTSNEDAISMFTTNKVDFESKKTDTNVETSASMKNYDTYSLTNNGEYSYLSRVENTFLYVNVKQELKDKVKDFVDKLGY